jgi:hypothetical protein
MRPLSLLAACLLYSASLVGCGGSGSGATPTPDFAEAAAEVVSDVRIGLENLPSGWEAAADRDLFDSIDLAPECEIGDPAVLYPGAVVSGRSEPLAGEGGSFLVSYAAVYRTEGEAAAALDGTDTLAARCQDNFQKAAEELVRQELEAAGIELGIFADVDSRFSSTNAEDDRANSRTYRMDVDVGLPGIRESFTLDVFIVRSSRVIGTAMYATVGEPDPNAQIAMASALAGNAREAEARLPASEPK